MSNKFLKTITLIIALLLSVNATTVFATDKKDDWSNLQDTYYGSYPAVRSLVDDEILMGSQIQLGTATKLYETDFNLFTKKGISQFIESVQENGLAEILKDNNTFYVQVKGKADPIPGTAIIRDGIVTEVNISDQGELYRFELDSEEKALLSKSKLTPANTTAKFVLVEGLMLGIVFDDGKNQLVQPMSSSEDILEAGKIYTIDELVSVIQKNVEILTKYEAVNANLDPLKPNVIVG